MGYLDNTGLAYLWGKIKAKLVQPDWLQNDETAPDYVKNRPGAYDAYEVNITWDGDTTGKTVTASDGNYFVKVSDSTPSKSKLLGGTLVYVDRQRAEEEVTTISIDESQIMELDGALLLSEAAVIVYNPPVSFESYSFTAAGVWFGGTEKLDTSASIAFCSSLRSSANIPIKIPQKYLDLDGYAQEADTILSTPQTLTDAQKQQARANIGLTPVAKNDAMTQSVGLDAETGELWTVPPTGDNIVLASSTTGSTKKFRIVVGDSGTLSAVEVTDAS